MAYADRDPLGDALAERGRGMSPAQFVSLYDGAVNHWTSQGVYLSARSTKDCRLTAGTKPKVRVKSRVGVTGGGNTGSLSAGKTFGTGKNGKKKLAREMAARRKEQMKKYR